MYHEPIHLGAYNFMSTGCIYLVGIPYAGRNAPIETLASPSTSAAIIVSDAVLAAQPTTLTLMAFLRFFQAAAGELERREFSSVLNRDRSSAVIGWPTIYP